MNSDSSLIRSAALVTLEKKQDCGDMYAEMRKNQNKEKAAVEIMCFSFFRFWMAATLASTLPTKFIS